MTVRWLLLDDSSLPGEFDWLEPDERKVLAGLKLEKRRQEWTLGRYAAKTLVASFVGSDALQGVRIVAAGDGAPEAYAEGARVDVSLSISHRSGVAACVLSPNASVGCDLEAVEPRTSRFVADFFTAHEAGLVEHSADEQRDLRVALTWSAKESTLKVLRVGLRRDTRCVEVDLRGIEGAGAGWHPFTTVVSPENQTLHGWWRREGDLVLTIAGDGSCFSSGDPLENQVDA